MNKRTKLLTELGLSLALFFTVGLGVSLSATAEDYGTSGTATPTIETPIVESGSNVTIGDWAYDSDAGNIEVSKNADGKTVAYFATAPTGKSRVYAAVEGHDITALPKLQVTYSCTKEFNFALYVNGTSVSLASYINITDNNGTLVYDLTEKINVNVESIWMMVDRSGYHNAATYTEEDPTKTVTLDFAFVGEESGVTIGDWAENASGELGNMQISKDANGKLVVHFPAAPTGKSRIKAAVTGYDYTKFPKLKVSYSCTKDFNLSIYYNGTGTGQSVLGYTNMQAGNGELVCAFPENSTVTSLILMVDRSGYHNAATYTEEDPTKTVTLDFAFVDADGNVPSTDDGIVVNGSKTVDCKVTNWNTAIADTVVANVTPFAGMGLEVKVGENCVYSTTFEGSAAQTIEADLSAYSEVEKVTFVLTGEGTMYFNEVSLSKKSAAWLASFDAVAADIHMTVGASIRLSTDGNGIRFETNVSKTLADALAAQVGNGLVSVQYGTLIIPADYFTEGATLESLRAENKVLEIVSTGFYDKASTADTYRYWGSIVNLQNFNYYRAFIGVGYVEVATEDDVYRAYATYDLTNARSMYQVAKTAYEGQSEAGYGEMQVQLLKAYLDGVVMIDTDGNYVGDVEGYAPAYQVTVDNGVYTITSTSEIKTVIYNGERIRSDLLTFGEDSKSVRFTIE